MLRRDDSFSVHVKRVFLEIVSLCSIEIRSRNGRIHVREDNSMRIVFPKSHVARAVIGKWLYLILLGGDLSRGCSCYLEVEMTLVLRVGCEILREFGH